MAENPKDMPNRTLDGMLEERYFSCKVVWRDDEPFRVDEDHDTGINLEYEVPSYSSNIDMAWHIIDKARERCQTVQINLKPDMVEVVFFSQEGKEMSRAEAEFTPRALAEAGLAASK